MKKTLCLLLVFIMLLSVASCGSDSAFSLGRLADGEYENEMLSVYFRIPEGWHAADEKEAESLLGMTRTVFTGKDEEELKKLEKKQSFDLGYAFVLSTEGGLDRFDLLYQKNTNKSDSASYIASAKKQLESYADLWEIRTVSNGNVTIRGREYAQLEMVLEGGDTLLRYYYCTTEVNGYFVTMILTTSDEDYSFDTFLSTLEATSAQHFEKK